MEHNFFYYFKQSMGSVGLPAPEGLFSTFAATLAYLKTAYEFLKRGGMGSYNVREMILTFPTGAGVGAALRGAAGTELLTVAGGMMASFYIGACIGALIYATSMTAPTKLVAIGSAFGSSIYDLLSWSRAQTTP